MSIRLSLKIICGIFLFFSWEYNLLFAADAKQKTETIGEVSIIGNTELPNLTFNLPWRLPSVEKREEQSPPREVPGMLSPIEPDRHKKQVYFSRYLEVEVPHFKAD